ncbi:hypothetical protein U1Q18_009545, partial [Sarracenia purpurea var. burkii]
MKSKTWDRRAFVPDLRSVSSGAAVCQSDGTGHRSCRVVGVVEPLVEWVVTGAG